MNVVVLADPPAVARAAADRVAARLAARPDAVLALPTGETPTALYRELVRRRRDEGLTFARATTFNLDEYVGLGADDPRSCAAYLAEHLFRHVDLDPSRRHLLDGRAPDLAAECARYEALLARRPVDLAVLGIGRNGHVAFNEPGAPPDGRTAVVALAPATRAVNARLYPPGTTLPDRGITMGLGTIGDAEELLLVAFGAAKADAIRAALAGPVDAACPASMLRAHARLEVLVDRAAAAGLA